MKKMTSIPVNWILLFKHSWIKKIQPLTLEWLDQHFRDFLKATQIWVWWTSLKEQPKP